MSRSRHDWLHVLGDKFAWTCYYCDEEVHCGTCAPQKIARRIATRDHLIPKVSGGKGGTNIVLSCWKCNHDKGSAFFHMRQSRPQLASSQRHECTRTAKTTYRTEEHANHMARVLLETYAAVVKSYPCTKCGYWHVGAIERRSA